MEMIKGLARLTYEASLEDLFMNSFNKITKGTIRHLKGKLLFKFWVLLGFWGLSYPLHPHAPESRNRIIE